MNKRVFNNKAKKETSSNLQAFDISYNQICKEKV
jgi:hypothetical protein